MKLGDALGKNREQMLFPSLFFDESPQVFPVKWWA